MSDFNNQIKPDAATFGRVGVLMGGTSSEREISLDSGQAILRALQASGFDAVGIDIADNPLKKIVGANLQTAFIALHGGEGEDGRIQALLEHLGIPYTGSGPAASSLAMNKLNTKLVAAGFDVPSPKFFVLNENSPWEKLLEELGGIAMIKPVREGSSIGMARVETPADFKKAYAVAMQFDDCVIAEAWVKGEEYTVALLDSKALPPIKLVANSDFYDFHAKYQSNDTQYICPCGLSAEEIRELSLLAEKTFFALGCKGWGRADFMRDSEGRFWLLEMNTVPGMTSHSLVPMAAKARGIAFNDLVGQILETV